MASRVCSSRLRLAGALAQGLPPPPPPHLAAQLSDPGEVLPDAGDASGDASAQEGGAYEPEEGVVQGLAGGEPWRRASSEESDASALGL